VTPREHRLRAREIQLRERELALRHWQARDAATSRIVEGGYRSLLWLNGVGALAMGAFFAIAIPMPEAEDLLPFLVAAVALHTLGLALAAALAWLRYMKRRCEDQRGRLGARNPWWWAVGAVSFASALLFLLGVALAVYGGFTSLDLQDDNGQASQVFQT